MFISHSVFFLAFMLLSLSHCTSRTPNVGNPSISTSTNTLQGSTRQTVNPSSSAQQTTATNSPAGTSPSTEEAINQLTKTISSDTTIVNFADINPILNSNCGGGGCHGPGASHKVYVGNENNVQKDRAKIISDINDGSMPPDFSIPPADQVTLLHYLSIDNGKPQAWVQTTPTTSASSLNSTSTVQAPAAQTATQMASTIVPFTTVNPILKNSCGGGACHSAGSSFGVYVGNEANVQTDKSKIISSIQSGSMPPGSSMPSSDQKTLLKYLSQ